MMGCFWILLKLLLLFISFGICSGVCPRRCACSTPAEVHCTFRALTHIPSTISKYVQRMNFGFNSITQISEASFKGLEKLELLMMHGNNMEKIPDGALQDLVSLQVLKLTYNKLSIITGRSFSGLSSLVRLHLDHNRISFIEPDAFMGLISLRLLHLESNRLTQIHPHTFSTLRILEFFTVSTLKILDLSDNQILGLSGDTMESLSQVEKIFIQGNPLSCDCRMGWMQSWRDMKPGVLQCKKDRSFARDQICPICASPKHLKGQNLLELKEFTCSAPSISSSEKTASLEGIWELIPIDRIKPPFGNISFTFSDDHATKVDLVCQVLKTESAKINWNSTKPLQIVTNITLSLDVECPVSRGDYESFWRLLAYYSDVPLHLRREIMLSREPSVSYRYKQNIEKDAYFYTGVRANVLAHPSWLMQANMNIKLNRPYSSSKSVRLLLDTHLFSSIDKGSDRPWVMIEHNNKTQTNFLSIIGAVVEMDCRIQSSGTPQIHWMLPDGTKIKPTSEKRRLAVTENGKLHIKPVEHRDDGVYYCIAEVSGDVDILAFRLSVIESSTPVPGNEIGNALTKFVGESASLPCLNTASPDAEIYWIFPNGSLANIYANSPRAVVFPNGTLSIPVSQLNNNGYYKCVVINQLGVDVLATKVTVMRRKGIKLVRKFPSKPQFASGVSTKVTAILKDVDEASGDASEEQEQRFPNKSFVHQRRAQNATAQGHLLGNIPQRHLFRKGDARRIRLLNQRKVNSKYKMDPQSWADLLAKIREKTSSKNVSGHGKSQQVNNTGLHFNTDISSGGSGAPDDTNTFKTPQQTDVSQKHAAIDGQHNIYQTTPLELYTHPNQAASHPTSVPHYAMSEGKTAKGGAVSTINAENKQVNSESVIKADFETENELDFAGKTGFPSKIAGFNPGQVESNSIATYLSGKINTNPPPSLSESRGSDPRSSRRGFGGRRRIRFKRPLSKITRRPLPTTDLRTSDKDTLRYSTPTQANTEYVPIQPTAKTFVWIRSETSFQSTPVHQTSTAFPQTKPFVSENESIYPTTTSAQIYSNVPNERVSNHPNLPTLTPTSSYFQLQEGFTNFLQNHSTTNSKSTNTFHQTSPSVSEILNLGNKDSTSSEEEDGSIASAEEIKDHIQIYPTTRLSSVTPSTTLPNANEEIHPTEISFSLRTDFPDYLHHSESPFKDPIREHVDRTIIKDKSLGSTILREPELSLFQTNSNAPIPTEFLKPTKNIDTTPTESVNASPVRPSFASSKETNGILLQASWGFKMEEQEGLVQASQKNPPTTASTTTLKLITIKQIQAESTEPLKKTRCNSLPTTTKASAKIQQENKIPSHSRNPGSNYIDYHSPSITHITPTISQTPLLTASFPNIRPTLKPQIFNSQAHPLNSTKSKNQIDIQESSNKPSNLPVLQTRPRISSAKVHTVTVNAGADVFLTCDSVGEPKTLLTWTKVSTGAVMSTNTKIHRFEVHPNGSLIIQNVQLQDRGQYLCTVQNPYGIDKMMLTLVVSANMPQMLLPRHQDVSVLLGNTALLPCHAQGLPTPNISWTLPDHSVFTLVGEMNQKVMLFPNGSLQIKNANYLDKGIYKCVASNAAGADMLSVQLQITALPPAIKEVRRENMTLLYGNSALIHCTVTGAPTPSIRWVTFYGTQLRPSQFINSNLFVLPNGTLFIRNPIERDSGIYECVAVNAVGLAKRSVNLQVKKGSNTARIVSTSPIKTEVGYGADLKLNCTATGSPSPRIIWRTPANKLIDAYYSSNWRMNVLHNGTLSISSVTEKDQGDYLCVARNKMGDDFVLLKVKVLMKAAKIDPKALHNHKVSYGGELKVDCIASGLPNPEITWSLPDGTTVNTTVRNKRYLMFNNGTLFVNEVGMNEEGDYTCSAENQIGKDQMRVHIKVVANSPIIRGDAYSVVKFNYGETGILNCSAKGEPTPNITWLCPDNSVLHPVSNKYQISNDGLLLISKLKKTDSGNYTCFARNVVGMVKKVVYVDVFVALPFIIGVQNPGILQRSVKKDQRVQLECNASGSPFPRIIWVFPNNVVLPAPYFGSRITVHRNGTLDIHAVRLSDSVELSCIARNEGGDTKLTVNLKVMEDVEKPRLQNPIYETITMNYSEITLNCSIEGKPTPEISWILPNGTTLFKGASVLGFHHRSDGALVIKGPTISDVGRYRCFGQNDAGNVERMVTLESSRKPEIVNKYTSLVSIINGENLHLHCLSSGLPVPQLTWTLPNGVILNRSQTSGLYSVHSNGTLTVQRTSVYDRGVYKCQTNNKHGSSTLSVSVIIIAYPPRITQGPSRVTYARPGKVLKIDCISLATPRAELVWETPDALQLKVDSQPRLYGNKFVHPDGSLRIQNLSTRDSGVYTCIASNVLGSDKRSTYVYVF